MTPTLKQWIGTLVLASAALALASCDQPQQGSRLSRANADRIADSSAPPRDPMRAGIEAPVNAPAAKAAIPGDEGALKIKVKSALLADRGVSALDIHVDAREGVVTLAGEVESPEARDRAVEIAEATPGVLRVVDQLTVRA